MGEICPKTKSEAPSLSQKLIPTPPSHNDNIKANPLLEKSLLPLIPSYPVYFFQAQFNHTVNLPYFKFVLLLILQQLGFSFC